MFPYVLTSALLGVVLLTILLRVWIGRPRKPGDGEMVDLYHPEVITQPDQIPAEHRLGSRKNANGYPTDGRRRTWAPVTARPRIALTPRMLERVNIQRKLRNRPPLNRAGFKNAVAHAWDNWRVDRDMDQTKWLGYLIAYEVILADHQSPTVAIFGGLTIDPNQPYNGQGGEFGGAGASGQWDADTARAAREITATTPAVGPPPSDPYAAIAADIRDRYASEGPTGGGSSYASPSYVSPEATINSAQSPSYSAPDTSSSSSYDSGSSSSSSDSGSSSSSGDGS